MMGDLGPAKAKCSLVPHKAENSNIARSRSGWEGEGAVNTERWKAVC